MRWHDGNVVVDHPRESWGTPARLHTLVHCRLDQLNGNAARDPAVQAAYKAAKFEFNLDAAYGLIDRFVRDDTMDALADVVVGSRVTPTVIFPHPAFDDDDAVGRHGAMPGPTNALPFAYAGHLEGTLGCPVNDQIVQSARVGRTKLAMFLRFLCQPSFKGHVNVDCPYIILDDVIASGGTFAALRSYIVRGGGTVISTTAFAHNTGAHQKFEVASDTLGMVLSLYGDGIDPYWLETFGHGIQCLTEAESQLLVRWALDRQQEGCAAGDQLLQRLRDRINQAASTGR